MEIYLSKTNSTKDVRILSFERKIGYETHRPEEFSLDHRYITIDGQRHSYIANRDGTYTIRIPREDLTKMIIGLLEQIRTSITVDEWNDFLIWSHSREDKVEVIELICKHLRMKRGELEPSKRVGELKPEPTAAKQEPVQSSGFVPQSEFPKEFNSKWFKRVDTDDLLVLLKGVDFCRLVPMEKWDEWEIEEAPIEYMTGGVYKVDGINYSGTVVDGFYLTIDTSDGWVDDEDVEYNEDDEEEYDD